MIEVIPGINEFDLKEIESKLSLISLLTKWVQIDVADGTFVPESTYFDASGLSQVINSYPHISFEAHLMVASPEKYIKPYADAGFARLIAHVEATDPRIFLEDAKFESVEVGMAIDGSTELSQIEPYLDEIDFALIMSIEAGPSGQEFLPETIERIKAVREGFPDLPIEVDGGINSQTVKLVEEAGAARAVVTSYIFKNEQHVESALKKLQGD
ncbi:hypothetical protein ACFL1A_03700 [Patescibacteria group bacterium]